MFVSLSTFLITLYIISIIFNIVVLGSVLGSDIEDFGDILIILGFSVIPIITLIIFVLILIISLIKFT